MEGDKPAIYRIVDEFDGSYKIEEKKYQYYSFKYIKKHRPVKLFRTKALATKYMRKIIPLIPKAFEEDETIKQKKTEIKKLQNELREYKEQIRHTLIKRADKVFPEYFIWELQN